MKIPFFRPEIGPEEIQEVVECLKSGWLTTGPRTKQFEEDFGKYVGSEHAVALNSATAALHLSLDAVGLKRGDSVLVPTMTFAATAEVVRYFDAKPIFVDCNERDFNLSPDDLLRQVDSASKNGECPKVILPVHFGGQAVDMEVVLAVARSLGASVVEDAAHCCPASYRNNENKEWKKVGSESTICCYSFYANKCITTGEGGMACTNDASLAERMRIMGLHGISKDAWKRFTSEGSWYYEIIAPGFKYNLTDLAAAIGLHQLRKADQFRNARGQVARLYTELLSDVAEVILPSELPNRIHSWHLYVIRIKLDKININRASVIESLRQAGIGASVHWIPLHMHPYYRETYRYKPTDFPVAARLSEEIISLPIYPGMSLGEVEYVVFNLKKIIGKALKH